MQSAQVQSLEALETIRNGYAIWIQDNKLALETIGLDLRKFKQWLESEQLSFWMAEKKRREQRLAEAKGELQRKKITREKDSPPTEQMMLVRKCKDRLDEAEEKLKTVQKWIPMVDRAILTFMGHWRQLANRVEVDGPAAIAQLDRMLEAVDRYLQVAPPSTGLTSSSTSAGAVNLSNSTTPVTAETAPTPAAVPLPDQVDGGTDPTDHR